MADTTDEHESAQPKSKKKLYAIAAIPVIGFAIWTFVLAPGGQAADTAAADAATIEEGEVVPIPELVLNLADADSLHYLRVGIALVLEKGTSAASIDSELPIASDVAVDVLSGHTFDELRAPGAKAAIKDELSAKVREAYDDAKVARVIFTSFVMQ